MALAKDLVPAFPAGQAVANGGQVNSALAALGSTLATGAPITSSITIVTGGDGTKCVTLPSMSPGDSCFIFNSSASNLPIFPPTSLVALSITGSGVGTVGSSVTCAAWKMALCVCATSTQYLVVFA